MVQDRLVDWIEKLVGLDQWVDIDQWGGIDQWIREEQ
jgi:hypothetical protein